MRVLVVNPGSSSLKASLIEVPGDLTLATTTHSWSPAAAATEDRHAVLARSVAELERAAGPGTVEAVGSRVVHGGTQFRAPTRVDDAVASQIEALDDLAPLHNRVAAEAIRGARVLLPNLPHVACFDTAFHATLDEAAWRYPLPAAWHERWGFRRFGFHGLSVGWAVERAAELLARPIGELELVVAHLGAGASVTAVAGGRSVDTSMGFTPLEGLMMGTRSGSVDPGILLHLLRDGMTVEALADGLERGSGLLGVSGRSGDVVELEAAAKTGDAQAGLALAMFARRAASWIAALATSLRRLDALIFTGGIGEHSAATRAAICSRLGTLGLEPPGESAGGDAVISRPEAAVSILRITAREDLVIARQTAAVLGRGDRPS